LAKTHEADFAFFLLSHTTHGQQVGASKNGDLVCASKQTFGFVALVVRFGRPAVCCYLHSPWVMGVLDPRKISPVHMKSTVSSSVGESHAKKRKYPM
jgi:hypothetical protein